MTNVTVLLQRYDINFCMGDILIRFTATRAKRCRVLFAHFQNGKATVFEESSPCALHQYKFRSVRKRKDFLKLREQK